MKKILFVIFMLMVGNTYAGDRVVVKGEDNWVGDALLQTECVNGFLFAALRTVTQSQFVQVYKPGTKKEGYRPQPVICNSYIPEGEK